MTSTGASSSIRQGDQAPILSSNRAAGSIIASFREARLDLSQIKIKLILHNNTSSDKTLNEIFEHYDSLNQSPENATRIDYLTKFFRDLDTYNLIQGKEISRENNVLVYDPRPSTEGLFSFQERPAANTAPGVSVQDPQRNLAGRIRILGSRTVEEPEVVSSLRERSDREIYDTVIFHELNGEEFSSSNLDEILEHFTARFNEPAVLSFLTAIHDDLEFSSDFGREPAARGIAMGYDEPILGTFNFFAENPSRGLIREAFNPNPFQNNNVFLGFENSEDYGDLSIAQLFDSGYATVSNTGNAGILFELPALLMNAIDVGLVFKDPDEEEINMERTMINLGGNKIRGVYSSAKDYFEIKSDRLEGLKPYLQNCKGITDVFRYLDHKVVKDLRTRNVSFRDQVYGNEGVRSQKAVGLEDVYGEILCALGEDFKVARFAYLLFNGLEEGQALDADELGGLSLSGIGAFAEAPLEMDAGVLSELMNLHVKFDDLSLVDKAAEIVFKDKKLGYLDSQTFSTRVKELLAEGPSDGDFFGSPL